MLSIADWDIIYDTPSIWNVDGSSNCPPLIGITRSADFFTPDNVLKLIVTKASPSTVLFWSSVEAFLTAV